MANRIEDYIRGEIIKYGTLCFALIDSENSSNAACRAKTAERMGASAILVGGSSATDQLELTEIVSSIKLRVKIPVILFPGNVTGLSPKADAILFSSLLNSESPYFITEAQALGALAVKKFKLETLPTGYLIIGEGTTAWFIGHARGIPFNKPEIAIMYSLAAQYLGMRFLYLEAGSGAIQNISSQMVSSVRKHYDGILIIGGGIRTPESAKEIAKAGADIIVIGTIIEKDGNWQDIFSSIVNSIRKR
jgi:phosphoglycerol geranylgeranyltransferase